MPSSDVKAGDLTMKDPTNDQIIGTITLLAFSAKR